MAQRAGDPAGGMLGRPWPHPRAHALFQIGDDPAVNVLEFAHVPIPFLWSAKQRRLLPGVARAVEMEGENRLLGRPEDETKLTALQGSFVFVLGGSLFGGEKGQRPSAPVYAASATMGLAFSLALKVMSGQARICAGDKRGARTHRKFRPALCHRNRWLPPTRGLG